MKTYRFEIGAGGAANKYERIHASELRAGSLDEAISIASAAAPLPIKGKKISIALLFDDRGAVVWFQCIDPRTHRQRKCVEATGLADMDD